MSKSIVVRYEGNPCYSIEIRRDFSDLLSCLQAVIPDLYKKRFCIVSETNVAPLYLDTVRKILEPAVSHVYSYVFQAGEQSKNLDTVSELYQVLISNKFDRNDILIALGGGVVGDLTGFAAATYLRGIRFVQIPTSLLAQVDSSIGGKTAVDFQQYKNMVGAFYQPALVYNNLEALKTLPEREYLSGMGEIIKHGLIRDASYYQWLKEHNRQIRNLDPDTLETMIEISDRIKREVVERDPKEKGERAHLNFGHTIGHAIEKLSDFSLLHGECVAIGMTAAAWLSQKKGMLTEAECLDIKQCISDFGLPVSNPQIDPALIAQTTLLDKKMDSGVVKFILLDGIGKAVINREITLADMEQAVKFL